MNTVETAQELQSLIENLEDTDLENYSGFAIRTLYHVQHVTPGDILWAARLGCWANISHTKRQFLLDYVDYYYGCELPRQGWPSHLPNIDREKLDNDLYQYLT